MKTKTLIRRRKRPNKDLLKFESLFAGRKLTGQSIRRIAGKIKKGVPIKLAMASVSVCEKTYYNWLDEGMRIREHVESEMDAGSKMEDILEKLGPRDILLLQFLQSIEKAKYIALEENLENIKSAGKKSWQASAWFLERRYPSEFGREQKESSVPNDLPSSPVVDIDRIREECVHEAFIERFRVLLEDSKKSGDSPDEVQEYEYLLAMAEGKDLSGLPKPACLIELEAHESRMREIESLCDS